MTVWTPEKKAAAVLKRAATLAAKNSKKSPVVLVPSPPVPPREPDAPQFIIAVDWEHLELPEAERWFGKLRAELDKAGRILNQRHSEPQFYPCKTCGKMIRDGEEKGRDNSYINPKTGLSEPARLCNEICWEKYQSKRIEERRKRNERERAG